MGDRSLGPVQITLDFGVNIIQYGSSSRFKILSQHDWLMPLFNGGAKASAWVIPCINAPLSEGNIFTHCDWERSL